jgi:RNA polymerase sigma-70 factor (ECF subfamily)
VDVNLVRRAQSGDREAFEMLAESVLDRSYAIATLILHDASLAEDATQEMLIRAWRSITRLRDSERFDGWLRQILVHACIDVARTQRHARSELALPDQLTDPDDLAAVAAERDALSRAYCTLTPVHRAAFVLRHFDGCSVAEVANALNIPVGTAKSRIHYAEQTVAHAMESDTDWVPQGGVA